MKIHRNHIKVHDEPPAVLLVDIAFNLLIFFVVCASTEPQEGRKQEIPGSEKSAQAAQAQSENIEIKLSKASTTVNGEPIKQADLSAKLKQLLRDRKRPEDRVVVVSSTQDTRYEHWINVTGAIEEAGGITTLQLEDTHEVQVQ